jgi:MerR family transcriptional regulator, repressor of the yfmOP operon
VSRATKKVDDAPVPGDIADLRIGEVAKLTGVTTRTLRYWAEIGVLEPGDHRQSGERLYSRAEVDRVLRIRELQVLLGFSLAEVRAVMDAEDVIDRLRSAIGRDIDIEGRKRLLVEAIESNDLLLRRLDDTLARIHSFRDERAGRAKRLRAAVRTLEAEAVPAGAAAKPAGGRAKK